MKQAFHNCSNADSCELGTKECQGEVGKDIGDMSNKIRLNNFAMQNELDILTQIDIAKKRGSGGGPDFYEFMSKKNEVNKELIKLQQKMKQVVTTKEEKYIELEFFHEKKLVVVEEIETLLKLNMRGAESPCTFYVQITDNSKADLKMYLSTDNPEPTEKKC